MGIKERRLRQREEMHRGILDAAKEIAASEGWPAVTIRRVAEKIEYSPPMIYEYFNSKEQIVIELLREGARQLLADMRSAREAHADPVEAVVGVGKAFWKFAQSHPEMLVGIHGEPAFQACVGHANAAGLKEGLGQQSPAAVRHAPFEEVHQHEDMLALYRARSPQLPADDPFPEGHEIFFEVRDALERAVGGSDHDLEDLSWKVVTVWGGTLGLITLAMGGLIPNARAEGERVVEKMLRDLLTVWRSEVRRAAH